MVIDTKYENEKKQYDDTISCFSLENQSKSRKQSPKFEYKFGFENFFLLAVI